MRGSAKNLVTSAQARGEAVAALNIDSIDTAMGVIMAAESAKSGFILQVTVETLEIWGWEFLTKTLLELINQAHVPIALLLDHAKNPESIRRAINLGFDAVMYDGSALPLGDNLAATREVVAYAQSYGVFVEGEVGHVARDGEPAQWEHLTSVEEATTYWSRAGVDALAVAVGSKHGHYRAKEDVHVERVREIAEATRAPLVLHGGSGMPADLFSDLIQAGIAKVNVGTALRRAWWAGIDATRDQKPREALLAARQRVLERSHKIIAQLQKNRLFP